jgi:hypothetical protein
MKKFQAGEIYFIREAEYGSEKLSPFVKVGLVRYKDKRDSFGRLSEHQTGNPRKLQLDPKHVVKTEAVDMVEAQLHRRFSKQRISGEWFEFKDEKSLKDAIKAAQILSEEVASLMPLFEEVIELENRESTLDPRPATQEEIALALTVVTARKQVEKCKEVAKVRDALITKAISEGTDPTRLGKESVTNYNPKFIEADFKTENEELWKKYLEEQESWSHMFVLDRKLQPESLGLEFEASIKEAEEIIASVAKGGNYSELVEVTLILRHLEGIAEWEDRVCSAKLKKQAGLHEKLEGACTWNRYVNKPKKFNAGKFAEENPALAKKYNSTPESKKRIVPKKGKTQ